MLIYPNVIKFNNNYYLHIQILKANEDETIFFKLVIDKKIVQRFVVNKLQNKESHIFRLEKNNINIGENIRLFYEKNERDFYVDSLKLYDCLIVDENQISFKIINEMKFKIIKKIIGVEDYD